MLITANPFKSGRYTVRIPKKSGFTLIETLVALAILSIFFTASAMIIQNVLQYIGQSRIRSTALSLAQEKMEIIRNLPYNQVGTVGGVPDGPIEPSEELLINSLKFIVTTSVVYFDDPYDKLTPDDTINTDYKRVRIQISWGGAYPSRTPIALVTNIVPKYKETLAGGGTLIINVFNAYGLPVSNATVSVDNDTVIPPIHISTYSDSEGKVSLPGSPACVSCYKISVSKQNYSTDRTYATSEVANPIQPDATVIEGDITNISFAIDELSMLVVSSYNSLYQPKSNVSFRLVGSKIIGYDTNDNPVYKYSQNKSTGPYIIYISSLEWDTYKLEFTSGNALAGSNPILPIPLPPKSNQSIRMIVIQGIYSSVLISVKDPSGTPLASASAVLSDVLTGAQLTKVTAATDTVNFGQVFFGEIPQSEYLLKVTLPGYEEATSSVFVINNESESITLNKL